MSFKFHGFKGPKLASVKYYITEAALGIARNSLMAVSSAATVATCVFIVVFSYCVAVNVGYLLQQIEDTVGITVFLDDSLSDDEVSALYNEILTIDHVKSAEYISAKQALENFASSLGDSQGIIMGLENDNPLRRSFSITIDDLKNQASVITRLSSTDMYNKGVSKVLDAENVTSALISLNNVIRVISVFIILALVLLSVVIIMNTIKLTVNSRRNEIKIMKYVGATDWFIKWPFILEGVFIGVFGSFISIFIAYAGYDGAVGALLRNFPLIGSMVKLKEGGEIFPMIAPLMVVLGAAIGAIGSVTSMNRHLDA